MDFSKRTPDFFLYSIVKEDGVVYKTNESVCTFLIRSHKFLPEDKYIEAVFPDYTSGLAGIEDDELIIDFLHKLNETGVIDDVSVEILSKEELPDHYAHYFPLDSDREKFKYFFKVRWDIDKIGALNYIVSLQSIRAIMIVPNITISFITLCKEKPEYDRFKLFLIAHVFNDHMPFNSNHTLCCRTHAYPVITKEEYQERIRKEISFRKSPSWPDSVNSIFMSTSYRHNESSVRSFESCESKEGYEKHLVVKPKEF